MSGPNPDGRGSREWDDGRVTLMGTGEMTNEGRMEGGGLDGVGGGGPWDRGGENARRD